MSQPTLPPDYVLYATPPSIPSYLALRQLSGLTPKTATQAARGLPGAWCSYHIDHVPSSTTVAMGRVISDGGWYFHVVDIAVLPDHQRRGLGNVIMTAIMERIRSEAEPGTYVNLLADPPGRSLYRRHGFVETAPGGGWNGYCVEVKTRARR